MTIASIIASRIIRDWDIKYSEVSLSHSLGETCAISQPMYCLRYSLSKLFDSANSHFDAQILVNHINVNTNSNNSMISQTSLGNLTQKPLRLPTIHVGREYFQGIVMYRIHLSLYFGGFWKKFIRKEQQESLRNYSSV